MTSRERIRKILELQTPDRIGIHDVFLKSTIDKWKMDGLPEDILPGDYFGFDLEFVDLETAVSEGVERKSDNGKFTILSFSGPFGRLCSVLGVENALRKSALIPKAFQADIIRETEHILSLLRLALGSGVSFDGAWVWEDLAYSARPFFSLLVYKRMLLPSHGNIFEFLNSRGLVPFFHSDGMIQGFLPCLIEAGARAFHPLEEASAMDIRGLIRDFKNDMVFVGGMNTARMLRKLGGYEELIDKVSMMKRESFYIYHADHPITPDISFEDYSRAVETIKMAGVYPG